MQKGGVAGRDFYTLAGYFFGLTMYIILVNMGVIVLNFPNEKKVFQKEENAQLYGTFIYFISKNIVESPFPILIPII